MNRLLTTAIVLATTLAATPATASLNVFQQFTGQFGLSTDGAGSTSGAYAVNAFVPAGATVAGAWLYQTNYNFAGIPGPYGVTLNGNALTFGAPVLNATACCGLFSARADVTSIVAPIINSGPGGTYSFDIREARPSGDSATDGVALVVVYQDPSLTSATTVAILDGFANVFGDSFTFNTATPMDPTAAGFFAELRLGIGFSCCGQASTVDVNGIRITNNAGNNDDGFGFISNGQLITVGGNNDPFSPFLPTYAQDTERYNLVPFINVGDTRIVVRTANASQDDNIFLAAFLVNAEGRVITPEVPEPATWAMMIAGFGLVGAAARKRRTVARTA
jgi:hypothetical protein